MNKAKIAIFFNPLTTLWIGFYIGSRVLETDNPVWYSAPATITLLMAFLFSILYVVNLLDKYKTLNEFMEDLLK